MAAMAVRPPVAMALAVAAVIPNVRIAAVICTRLITMAAMRAAAKAANSAPIMGIMVSMLRPNMMMASAIVENNL